jgi:hypothetical protein
VIDGLAQVLDGNVGYAGVLVVDQNGMDGRQRFIHEWDGGYAGEDCEGGRLLGGGGSIRGGGGGSFCRGHRVRGDGGGEEEREEGGIRF